MTNEEILLFIIYIAAGIVVGIFVNRLLIPFLRKLAKRSKIKSDDLIVATVAVWILPWFVALGLFIGLQQVEMPTKYYDWIQRGLVIFYLFSATVILATILSGMVKIKSGSDDSILPSSSIISKIAKVAIYIFGFIFILQSQGVSVTGMLTALGVGGLAVALALQNTLANLFAGLQIISSGKFNPGDFVQLNSGEDGNILDISWRSTTIQAANNHIIVVPNSKMADMIIHNFTLPDPEFTFIVPFGVSYDSDLVHVEKVTLEVIKETIDELDGGVKDWEPFIRYYQFGDSSIDIKAFFRLKQYTDQFIIRHEFIKKLHQRFNAEGINIPFPIRTLIMQKEEGDGKEDQQRISGN